jgi:hypothetical protein
MMMPPYLEDFLMLRIREAESFVGELASVATIGKHEGKELASLLMQLLAILSSNHHAPNNSL